MADTLGVDYAEVYQRMDAVKMIDEYIIPNYEVLHLESRKNVTEGLIDTLKRWVEGEQRRGFMMRKQGCIFRGTYMF